MVCYYFKEMIKNLGAVRNTLSKFTKEHMDELIKEINV